MACTHLHGGVETQPWGGAVPLGPFIVGKRMRVSGMEEGLKQSPGDGLKV